MIESCVGFAELLAELREETLQVQTALELAQEAENSSDMDESQMLRDEVLLHALYSFPRLSNYSIFLSQKTGKNLNQDESSAYFDLSP